MIECEFCEHQFPGELSRYGCPNCGGEAVRIEQPTPCEIKSARQSTGLSQTAAAALIHSTMRTWQDWEAGKAKMHLGLWELFVLKVRNGK